MIPEDMVFLVLLCHSLNLVFVYRNISRYFFQSGIVDYSVLHFWPRRFSLLIVAIVEIYVKNYRGRLFYVVCILFRRLYSKLSFPCLIEVVRFSLLSVMSRNLFLSGVTWSLKKLKCLSFISSEFKIFFFIDLISSPFLALFLAISLCSLDLESMGF